MKRDTLIELLKKYKPFIRSKYQIDTIAVFGSHARDHASNKSDVDILIATKNKSFRNRLQLRHFLEEKLHTQVDIGYFDTLHPFIQKDIKDEIIYV